MGTMDNDETLYLVREDKKMTVEQVIDYVDEFGTSQVKLDASRFYGQEN